MLYMDLEYRKGILVVRLDGNLTRKNVYHINNYLTPVIKKHHIQKLIYNFSSILKIDDAGIDAILRTKCIIKENQGMIYFCGIPEHLKEKLKHLRVKEVNNERMAFKLLKV